MIDKKKIVSHKIDAHKTPNSKQATWQMIKVKPLKAQKNWIWAINSLCTHVFLIADKEYPHTSQIFQ